MSIHVTENLQEFSILFFIQFKDFQTFLSSLSEQETREGGEVVGPPVRGAGVGVEVDRHLVPSLQLRYHHLTNSTPYTPPGLWCYLYLTGHAVGVVVVMVLIVDAGQLLSISSDGEKDLLLVLGADCEAQQIITRDGDREDSGPSGKGL